jgi:hypothetical protein
MFDRCLGLKQPDKPNIAPDYGTAIHKAVPHCYTGDSDDLTVAKHEFAKCWEAFGYGEGDKKRNTNTAYLSLDNFWDTHNPQNCPYEIIKFPFQAPTGATVHDDEVPFAVDIGGPLVLAGRIDAPIRWKTNQTVWALDYKTAGEISARYFDGFHFCPQACGYTIGLSHLMPDQKVSGMVVEAIRVSASNIESQLNMVFCAEHQLKDFIEFTNNKADEILCCNSSGSWPKHPTGCGPYQMFYQPGRYCEYRKLCDLPNWRDGTQFYEKTEPYHPFELVKE